MKKILKELRAFAVKEDGLETVEYAIVAALITVAVITAIATVGTNVAAKFTSLANTIGN